MSPRTRLSRGYLIAISGVDCSGKTTQLERLAERLRREGYSTRVFWYRPGYSKNLDALRSIIRSIRRDALPPPGPNARRDAVFRDPRIKAAWIAVALADTLVELSLRLRYALTRGEVLLCDRYLFDGLLDLQLRFPNALPNRAELILKSLCPCPDLHLLLSMPWEDVEVRRNQKNEPFPDPENLRSKRYDAYRTLAQSPGTTVVDATGTIDSVHDVIWSRVQHILAAS